MKKIVANSFFIILFSSLLLAKNLTLHDFDNPSASHILDSEIIDNILIVSGMIGGIEFYDISNPEILNHLTTLQLSGGGGGGQGGGGRRDMALAGGTDLNKIDDAKKILINKIKD